jgi:hypothetical protein
MPKMRVSVYLVSSGVSLLDLQWPSLCVGTPGNFVQISSSNDTSQIRLQPILMVSFFFMWYWGLNSGLHTC